MLNEPVWISIEAVISANKAATNKTGEPFCLRDRDLLEGALFRVQNRFIYEGETDIFRLATSLILSIAGQQAFVQGNKRTALISGLLFTRINGYRVVVDDSRAQLGKLILSVLDGHDAPEVVSSTLRNGAQAV